MMIRHVPGLLALVVLLSACGTAPPVPSDRYYRLSTVRITAPDDLAPNQALTVHPLRAESLYAERAMVFTDDRNPRQLRQYHYHLWLYPPSQLVQDHLAASLAEAIEIAPPGKAKLALQGRVLRFDRILGGTGNHATAELELQVFEDGRAVFGKTYQATGLATDDSFQAFVEAMESALSAIYRNFLQDLAKAHAVDSSDHPAHAMRRP